MNSSASPEWVCLEDCVWRGPEWFSYHHCLQSVSEYQPLYGLLVNTLELKDAGLDDYLDYLEHIKYSEIYLSSKEEESKISLIYKALNELAVQDRTKAAEAEIGYVSFDVFYVPFSQPSAPLTSTETDLKSMSLFTVLELRPGNHQQIASGLRTTSSFRRSFPWLHHTKTKQLSFKESSESKSRTWRCTSMLSAKRHYSPQTSKAFNRR